MNLLHREVSLERDVRDWYKNNEHQISFYSTNLQYYAIRFNRLNPVHLEKIISIFIKNYKYNIGDKGIRIFECYNHKSIGSTKFNLMCEILPLLQVGDG